MNRSPALLALLFAAAIPAVPAAAQQVVVGEWVEVEAQAPASRFVTRALEQAEEAALAAYGPFRVLDESTVALVDVTDGASPAQFAALLRAYPGVRTLRFHDCPGTEDDIANLKLGRMIRAAGLAVEVPEGGSVRSGAVELVLAGTSLAIAEGAEFAVHGWIDEDGLGAADYAPDAPEHRKYLAYYREMGLEAGLAERFYAMTNSVPFERALWLTGSDMRGWIAGAAAASRPAQEAAAEAHETALPKLAYLDLGAALN